MRGRMVPLEVPRPRDRIRVARWWRRAAWLTGAGGLAALVLGALACGPARSAPRVVPHPVERGPIWVFQAAWDWAEKHLLLADPVSGAIYQYDRKGRIVRRLQKHGDGPLEFSRPAIAFRVGKRYLVADDLYRWLWLDRTLRARAAFGLRWDAEENPEYGELAESEMAAGTTRFFGIGRIRTQGNEWSGLEAFALDYENPRGIERFGPLDFEDAVEERLFDLLASRLAACGDEAFLLRLTPEARVEQLGRAGRRLESFPEEFRHRPALASALQGSGDREQWDAAVRRARLPDSLYCVGKGGPLLLLARAPRKEGGVDWYVYPIDIRADRLLPRIELPTKASDILFAPGRTVWAVFDKAETTAFGNQPLTKLRVFPAPSFAGLERGKP
ncbi:MAG: hypothetical protein BWX64_02523 [Acidobacteria bacterium ADurb.Bin051]|nr:MAG: hypothetical protein BWX64_02523 [Acidobacteria bacterium ADurb.Bin051]